MMTSISGDMRSSLVIHLAMSPKVPWVCICDEFEGFRAWVVWVSNHPWGQQHMRYLIGYLVL